MDKDQNYSSGISPKRKKKLYIGLLLYGLGFLILWTIGDSINSNPYLLRGFLAPALILSAIIYIIWILYRKKE